MNEAAHLLVVTHSAFFFHRLWDRDLLLTECGGVLWHVVALARQEGLSLEDLLSFLLPLCEPTEPPLEEVMQANTRLLLAADVSIRHRYFLPGRLGHEQGVGRVEHEQP